MCVQQQLKYLGHDPGPIDGFIGPQTRAAAEKWFGNQNLADDDLRFPDLTRITALQWCREIGLMRQAAKRFWPSQNDIRYLVDEPKTEVKLLLLREVLTEARRFYRENYGIEIAGSFDVIGAESERELENILTQTRRERELNFRFSGELRLCNEGGTHAFVYTQTLGICLETSKDDDMFSSYLSRNITAYFVAAHEFMHLVQFEFSHNHLISKFLSSTGYPVLGPDWLTEGTATYFHTEFLYEFHKFDRAPLSELLVSANKSEETLTELRENGTMKTLAHYELGQLASALLAQKFGEQSLFDYWRELGRLSNQDAAFQSTFGMSLDDFEVEFESLRRDLPSALTYGRDKSEEGLAGAALPDVSPLPGGGAGKRPLENLKSE